MYTYIYLYIKESVDYYYILYYISNRIKLFSEDCRMSYHICQLLLWPTVADCICSYYYL